MATGVTPADTATLRPRPRVESHARARARHPPRAADHARALHSRAFRARGQTRMPAKSGQIHYDNTN